MPAILRFFQIYLPASVMRKLATLAVLIGLGFLVQDFLVLFFITFIFAYLFLEVGETLAHRIHSWWREGKKDTPHIIAAKYATTNTVVTVLYIVFVMVLVFIFVNILPKISLEIGEFIRKTGAISQSASELVTRLEATMNLRLGLDRIVVDYINSANIEAIGQKIISYIRDGGVILVKFFLALILSYIFILERKQIEVFLQKIRRGNFSFFYEEGAIVANRFGKWFGLIFRAQGIIALVNTVITTIGLLTIWLVSQGTTFPYIVTLALLVFIFGFVPVFGTFISSVPIIIIGYGLGGWSVMIACIIMVIVVHAVEAYYLNPKIVSAYVHFPVFITFVILLLAEHFFGLIGLLIGVPVVSILIDFIEDIDLYVNDVKRRLQNG
jgi:predicted PurR-regulated permease PerM